MRKVLLVVMLLAIACAVDAADSPVPMQSLLDKGFKVMTANAGRLILQKDNQAFSCGPNISTPQTSVSGDTIFTTYACVQLH